MARRSILLVEDNPADVALLRDVLTGHDIAVQSFDDPREALVALLSDAGPIPDLVVLDHAMPNMTGLEWLTRVRADPRFAELPVVIWTGNGSLAEIDRARELKAAIKRKTGDYQGLLWFASCLALQLDQRDSLPRGWPTADSGPAPGSG